METAIRQGNTVELIEYAGNDLGHALSAWTSTSRDLTPSKLNRVGSLLRGLMGDEHHTPFEKSYLRFLIRVDNASHIHLLKHRIAVCINGESARYKEYENPTFYIPPDWPVDVREHYTNIFTDQFAEYYELRKNLEAHYFSTTGDAKYAKKRAKETARYILPMGLQITLDVSFNWRSFIHFLVLRDSSHAQNEISEIARQMLQQVEATMAFPVTVKVAKTYIVVRQMLPKLFRFWDKAEEGEQQKLLDILDGGQNG